MDAQKLVRKQVNRKTNGLLCCQHSFAFCNTFPSKTETQAQWFAIYLRFSQFHTPLQLLVSC